MSEPSIHDPLPPRRRFSSPWDFVVRGYRPIGCWVAVITLFVHLVVLPIADLFGRHVERLSAVELATIVTLLGLGWHQRSKEKREGLTS